MRFSLRFSLVASTSIIALFTAVNGFSHNLNDSDVRCEHLNTLEHYTSNLNEGELGELKKSLPCKCGCGCTNGCMCMCAVCCFAYVLIQDIILSPEIFEKTIASISCCHNLKTFISTLDRPPPS